ncbi:hypothetical protein BC835DRAFT_1305144 [Cytidiella melzeri]|nr:hypothetical protein BC835DRAFT_1305144 [Cytidiella melzeri]
MSSNSEWYVVVDDQSPKIVYEGAWFNENVKNARNGSVSATSTVGSKASFTFQGNHVAVNGPVLFFDAKNPPVSTYSIDGQTPGVFVPSVEANNTFKTFFVSPQLSDAQHTLDITLANDGVPFFLDSILFNATSLAQVTSAGLQPTIITTIIVAPSTTTSPKGKDDASSAKSSLVAPVLGGIVGGVAILVAGLLVWYFLYFRRRSRHYDYRPMGDETEAKRSRQSYGISPFQTTTSPLHHTERSVSVYSTTSFHSADTRGPLPLADYSTPPTATAQPVFSPSYPPTAGPGSASVYAPPPTPRSKALEARSRALRHPSSRTSEPVLHADSGYRFTEGGSSASSSSSGPQAPLIDPEIPDELPPTYSER